MTDEMVKRLRKGRENAADRIEALTAEYEEAMECNEQFFVDNEFLKKRVEETRKEWEGWQSAAIKLMKQVTALTAERDRLRGALADIVSWETMSANATVTRMANRARAALKGETP